MKPGCGNGTLVMTWLRNQSRPRVLGELVDAVGIDARVDRPAHQDHGLRHVRILVGFHQRDGGQHRHRRLAHRDHMRIAAEHVQDGNHVVDIIVEIEAALRHRHRAGVAPVGDVDVVIGQEGLDGAAQQRRVMARHRRDDQQLRLRPARRAREGALEMQQPAERPLPHRFDMHRHAFAADDGRIDAPFRPAVDARRALEQFGRGGNRFAVGGVRRAGWPGS